MAPRKARSSCGYRITDRLADSTKPNTLSNFQTRRLLLLSGFTLFSGPCSAAHHWHPPGMRPAAKQEATDTFATQAPISPVIPLNQTRALLMSLIQPLADWRSSDGCSRVPPSHTILGGSLILTVNIYALHSNLERFSLNFDPR